MSTKSKIEPRLDAAAVIAKIVAGDQAIARIRLFEFAPAPLVQQRLSSKDQYKDIIEAGLSLRARYRFPFWDGTLLSCFGYPDPPLDILRAASYHNPSTTHLRVLERSDVSVDVLHALAEGIPPAHLLAVSSLVELHDGSHCHVPMLDFHCPASPENLGLVKCVVTQLGIGGGFILESGESYHFYGLRLLKERELTAFLGRALLYAPIVDKCWIAHQLIESACALRISSRGPDGDMPCVVLLA
jgi:hypothetical protein